MNNNSWKAFFTYTKDERKGIYALTVIILLLIIFTIFGDFMSFNSIMKTDFSDFDNEIAKYKTAVNKKSLEEKNTNSYKKNKLEKKLNLKYFNPNFATKEDWIAIGLDEKQALSILKYINKGGSFKKAEDINKIYCLSDYEKKSLLPFIKIEIIEIEEDISKFDYSNNFETDKTILYLDLNSVNFEDLLEVRGIGPATAKSIIKYRELLGSFYTVEQLKEVYLIDSLKFTQLRSSFYVTNNSSTKFLDLNKNSYFELRKHPYINNANAYNIIEYRKTHGNFTSIEQIKNAQGINDSIYERIYRYFAPLK